VPPDLDPQVKDFLATAPGFTGADTAEQARANHVATASGLAGPPEDVGEARDLAIPGPAGEIPARLVRPVGLSADASLPLVVFLHGGGWVVGTLDTYAPLQHAMANASGAAVLSVDYRLAPEHEHPAAVQDALVATRWALDHAADLGADPARVGVAGDSAGGHLAAVVARRLAAHLAFQVLVYPVLDATCSRPSFTENATGYFLEAEGMRWYWEQYLPDGADPHDPDVSPVHAPLEGRLPPAFVLTTGLDVLRDEGDDYADRLEAAGTRVTRLAVPGQVHGYVRWLAVMDAARDAVEAVGAFVREASPVSAR